MRFVQLPSAPQVALTEPSGLQASVVLHLDPLGVLPQMLFHAKLLNWPGGLTGGFGGAMLHVSALQRSAQQQQEDGQVSVQHTCQLQHAYAASSVRQPLGNNAASAFTLHMHCLD